jgi:hypothetical protein
MKFARFLTEDAILEERVEMLSELREVLYPERFNKDAERLNIAWKHGILAVDPEQADVLRMMFPLIFAARPKKKTVAVYPMDDWSDFKKIKEMQQALADMVRAKLITPKWKFVVGNPKNTKMTLGSTRVADVLKYDANFDRVVPHAFHGTSDHHLESIKKFGLAPPRYGKGDLNWDIGYTEVSDQNVYMTMDFDRAAYYANYAVSSLEKRGVKSKPIVVQVDNLPIEKVNVDDDFRSNMGMLQLIQFLHAGKKVDPKNYISGIRSSGQFAYRGRIPATMIAKIHKVK